MIYISVAEDKAGELRVYLTINPSRTNTRNEKMYCTEALKLRQIPIYLDLLKESVLAFVDPLTSTPMKLATAMTLPATERKAIGISDLRNEAWHVIYDERNRSRKATLIEEGKRWIVCPEYKVQFGRLFNNLQALLDEQREMEIIGIQVKDIRAYIVEKEKEMKRLK